jgi:sulfoxide reductase catalytic subunit YedY
MLIKTSHRDFNHAVSSEITQRNVYEGRRDLLKMLATGVAGGAMASWASRQALAQSSAWGQRPGKLASLSFQAAKLDGAMTMEKVTPYKDASSYNNFYEFGTDKADPAVNAHTLKTSPWSVEIEGLVKKPGKLNLEDLLKLSPMEERIYRLRCVEGWSMVIPWVGYSLADLIKRVEPLGSAKYVEFVTLADPKTMPFVGSRVLDWPYVEGLRLDEAMHPLTLLTFGMYGEVLPNQSGAPVRLVVPWKYGFKSGKSIVKIRFTDKQPGLEQGGGERIWVLFQREPFGGSPPLESSQRTAYWRGWPVCQKTQNLDVQWLRSPSRPALCGHGLEEVVLSPGVQR